MRVIGSLFRIFPLVITNTTSVITVTNSKCHRSVRISSIRLLFLYRFSVAIKVVLLIYATAFVVGKDFYFIAI